MPSQIDNVIIQVRARLQEQSIKLWQEPYFHPDIGCVESELDKLAEEFSSSLSIPIICCKSALSELQDGALRKLATRKEFEETGLATFNVRIVNNDQGTQRIFEIKCLLSSNGKELQKIIADKLVLKDGDRVKCISAGKIVDSQKTLLEQGLQNNQQLMCIVSEVNENGVIRESMYERLKRIKSDVEAIVDSNMQLFEMEDQDGNPIFLPPDENRALLMAMGFCEKARAVMTNSNYEEALILLLEADDKFTTCNSKFLESVDNYALVNLDIVWCYLCLKNVTQLPDASRRLDICEKSFRRSYGENMNRLKAIKGDACPERALIMRLHLLQGIVCFHQNRRDEAYEKLETAATELQELKVDDSSVDQMVAMGYEAHQARVALRACRGNIAEAVNFIYNRKQKTLEARERSKKERYINEKLKQSAKKGDNWVNPKSVASLVEMGFPSELVTVALRKTQNNITKAIDMLQSDSNTLREQIKPEENANENLVEQLKTIGFTEEMVRAALQMSHNDIDKSIEFLLQSFGTEEELLTSIERFAQTASLSGPSTSTGANSLLCEVMKKAKDKAESLRAYERFNKDLSQCEFDYLDLPLLQEEQLLIEYKQLLEQ